MTFESYISMLYPKGVAHKCRIAHDDEKERGFQPTFDQTVQTES